jgi:hypothetical protein
MNPWITFQAADARIDDLLHAAALDRLARDAAAHGRLRFGPSSSARPAAERLTRGRGFARR